MNAALQAHGLKPFSLKQVKTFIGRGAPELVKRALMARAIINPPLAAAILDALLASYETSFARTRLYPGVVAALRAISIPCAVCTNKPAAATAAVLDHFGLAPFFRAVVCGDTLPQRKPDPAPLLHAAALIGARFPVMIGDSEVDSEAAAAAGMPYVHFSRGYCNGPVRQQLTIDRFDDIEVLFGNPPFDFVFP